MGALRLSFGANPSATPALCEFKPKPAAPESLPQSRVYDSAAEVPEIGSNASAPMLVTARRPTPPQKVSEFKSAAEYVQTVRTAEEGLVNLYARKCVLAALAGTATTTSSKQEREQVLAQLASAAATTGAGTFLSQFVRLMVQSQDARDIQELRRSLLSLIAGEIATLTPGGTPALPITNELVTEHMCQLLSLARQSDSKAPAFGVAFELATWLGSLFLDVLDANSSGNGSALTAVLVPVASAAVSLTLLTRGVLLEDSERYPLSVPPTLSCC